MKLDEEEIRQLIAQDRLDIFYESKRWRRRTRKARKQQHNECQRCKRKGYYSPCDIVHHKKYLKVRPDLAFDLDNLECLCFSCHKEEHMRAGAAAGAAGYRNDERW